MRDGAVPPVPHRDHDLGVGVGVHHHAVRLQVVSGASGRPRQVDPGRFHRPDEEEDHVLAAHQGVGREGATAGPERDPVMGQTVDGTLVAAGYRRMSVNPASSGAALDRRSRGPARRPPRSKRSPAVSRSQQHREHRYYVPGHSSRHYEHRPSRDFLVLTPG